MQARSRNLIRRVMIAQWTWSQSCIVMTAAVVANYPGRVCLLCSSDYRPILASHSETPWGPPLVRPTVAFPARPTRAGPSLDSYVNKTQLNAIVDRFRIPLCVVLWLFYNACQQLLYCRLICSVTRHFKAVQLRGAMGVKVAKILVVVNNICHFLLNLILSRLGIKIYYKLQIIL